MIERVKLLEYEAKRVLDRNLIPTPESFLVDNTNETAPFLPAVIKSQVPVGGRGKAGGVQIVTTQEEYTRTIEKVAQLPIKGYLPRHLLAEEAVIIERELYLAVLIDKSAHSIVLMAHINGGIEVESNNTDDFFKRTLTYDNSESVGEELSQYYDLPGQSFALQDLVKNLYNCFIKNDATLIEINPLILTQDNHLIAGDCKMELDDAASFRHDDWAFEQAIAETNFVTLDEHGTVATIANGAGLAMATVDAVADAGMKPANFLDIGGGANEASILAAFKRIVEYPNVSVIIINIFAGITRCDEVAKAIIAAQAHITSLPKLYIRLAGTNFEAAATLLARENIPTLATLDECVAAAKESNS